MAELELFFASRSLVVVNGPTEAAHTRMKTTSSNVAAVDNCLSRDIYHWKVLLSLRVSSHGYISFKLRCSHSLDTNAVMKTRFIFGTQCVVPMLAAGDRKLAAQLR